MPVPAGDSVGRLAVPGAPTARLPPPGLFPDPERVRVAVQAESAHNPDHNKAMGAVDATRARAQGEGSGGGAPVAGAAQPAAANRPREISVHQGLRFEQFVENYITDDFLPSFE